MWIGWGQGYFIGNRYLESFLLLYPHFFFLRRGHDLIYALFLSVMTRLWRILISVGLPRVLFSTQPVGSFMSGFPSLLSFVPLESLNVRHTFIQYYSFESSSVDCSLLAWSTGIHYAPSPTHDQLPPHSLPDAF